MEGGLNLFFSISGNNSKIVELLINYGANVTVLDRFLNSPINLAIISENPKIVELLLQKNVDVNVANKIGIAPLHRAATYGIHFF